MQNLTHSHWSFLLHLKDALKAWKINMYFFYTLSRGSRSQNEQLFRKYTAEMKHRWLYSKWLLFVQACVYISTCDCHSAAWGRCLARASVARRNRLRPSTASSSQFPFILPMWPRHMHTTESHVCVCVWVDETRLTEPFKALQLTLSGCRFIFYLFDSFFFVSEQTNRFWPSTC